MSDSTDTTPPRIQSDTFLVTHKPTRMRYTVWDGTAYRDRWLMIAPIDPITKKPLETSQCGLLTNNNGIIAPIYKGQVCIYGSLVDNPRSIAIFNSVEDVTIGFDVVGKVSASE